MHRSSLPISALVITIILTGCHLKARLPKTIIEYIPFLQKAEIPTIVPSLVPTQDFKMHTTSEPPHESSPSPNSKIEPTLLVLLPLVIHPKDVLDLSWKVVPKTIEYSQRNGTWTLKLVTPWIEGKTDDPVAEFNRQFQEIVAKEEDDFMASIKASLPDIPGGYWISTYQVTTSPDWKLLSVSEALATTPTPRKAAQEVIDTGHTLLGILFQVETYTGFSEPLDHYMVINYDLSTGKSLMLSNLFKPGINYLDAIADYTIPALLLSPNPLPDLIQRGAAAKEENYSNWNLTPTGLLITFLPGQVGPLSAGAQQVLLPYGFLSALLDPLGPLSIYSR